MFVFDFFDNFGKIYQEVSNRKNTVYPQNFGFINRKNVDNEGGAVLEDVKIVFSDIDGTFITNDHRVTEPTAKAVRALLAGNIPLVLVSARMPEAIYPITRKIGVNIPIISYSGGLVLTEREEVLYDKRIGAADAAAVLAKIAADFPAATTNYYAGRHWYAERINDAVKNEMNITEAVAEQVSYSELLNKKILPSKILVMAEPTMCEEMEKVLGAAHPALNVVRSSKILLEIMDKSVSKATGIEVLLKHLGIGKEAALAFGDNYNDAEMLKLIPHSVAMGNAPEPVKNMAAHVTLSNEEDGISAFLQEQGII